jgi:hypothetical protein
MILNLPAPDLGGENVIWTHSSASEMEVRLHDL